MGQNSKKKGDNAGVMMRNGKNSKNFWKKGMSVLLSTALVAGSLTLTDSMDAEAASLMSLEEWEASVSGNDASVSGGDVALLSLTAEEETGYAQYTQDELIYSFQFGTDVLKKHTYGTWIQEGSSTPVNVGFRDVEYAEEAKGWDGSVYYPRTVSRDAEGASYVSDAEGYLTITGKVWTETESTGYGVFTYENTSEFSMELPNADYRVTVTFVNPTDTDYSAYIESEEITKVESTAIAAGGSATVGYTAVLVDGRLDIKFLAASSATSESDAATQAVYVSGVEVTRLATNATEAKPTVFIASDSTVQTYDSSYYPQTGWGQVIHNFFGEFVEERECDNCNYGQAQTYETDRVVVENRAIGGRSSSSFILEGKLDDLLEDVKPGDYVLIQWGHNDATTSRPNRYVASSDFEEWIQYYVNGAVQRGATPILVTPVARYSYTTDADGNLISYASNFESYRQVMIKMAAEQEIALVDLTQRSVDLANSFGIDGGKSLWLWVNAGDYPDGAYKNGATDSTHLQYYGAYKFAQCVAKGIRDTSNGSSSYAAEQNISEANRAALATLASTVTLNEAATAPSQVTGLEVVSAGSSSVSLRWEKDDASELYYIYRAELAGGETAEDVTFDAADKYSVSSSVKYTDSNCEAGKTYVYAVAGFNDKGTGEFSEKVTVTTKDAGWKFDFNYKDSQTQDSWIGVGESEAYTDAKGYGFTTAPGNGRNRPEESMVADTTGELAAMGRDFVLGTSVFEVKVPNGDYEVTCYAGDLLKGGSTIKSNFTGEGKSIGQVSAKQSIGKVTGTVRVTDGKLTIGNDGYMMGLTITEIVKAPSALTVTESKVEGSKMQFLLGFTGVDGAVSYNVYRKGTTDTDFAVVKSFTTEDFANDENGCKQQSANLGETYEFYMTAVLADGTESAPSETITVKTVLTGVPVTEAPRNVKCTSPAEGETTLQHTITIEWDAVVATTGTSEADADNQGKSFPAISYNIYRSTRKEGEKGYTGFVKVGSSSTTSFTDTDEDIATNIHYYYMVTAVNAGGESEKSEVCTTPVAGTLVPGTRETYTDRALVAVSLSEQVKAIGTDGQDITEGVYLSWRAFEADFDSDNNLKTTFTVYVNDTPVANAKDVAVTNMVLTDVPAGATFKVAGSNDSSTGLTAKSVSAWDNQYLEFQLQKPADQTMPDGTTANYTANDMSVGDVDGDGVLELIVKWYPSNAKDNSGSGYTGTTILDTYDVDWNSGNAVLLSRIDLGVNIRSGAHYTQFQVWDFDGDGKAEVAVKTADGTTSYDGNLTEVAYVGACNTSALPVNTVSAANDYRNSGGYILDGPEYFSIFNLEDGTKAAEDVDYLPNRGTVSRWGDAYGNRVDRFLSATAYLDGEHAFAVMCRGYYTRTALTAYGMKDTDNDGVGDEIYVYWRYDTDDNDGANEGQGNHNLAVADVDNDGKDEIVYGSSCYDHDGTLKYSTGLGHGDAMHISDWVEWNDGLEVMEVHEEHNQTYQVEIHDAETGEMLIGYPVKDTDVGRGVASDIDPTSQGAEFWASNAPDGSGSGEWDSVDSAVLGTQNSTTKKWDYLTYGSTPAVNGTIFWDGDLLAEIQDHRFNQADYVPLSVVIADWDYENGKQVTLLDSEEIYSSNGTKGNLGLIADLMGDWREEFIARCSADDSKVRLYTTTYVTDYVVPCLLEDLQYREGVAWENVGYNQPTHLSYMPSKGLVTAQLAEGVGDVSSAKFNFTKASDGTLYGHDITGYQIYRAESEDGEYQLIDTLTLDKLVDAATGDTAEEETQQPTVQRKVLFSENFEDGTNDSFTLITAGNTAYEYLEADTATVNQNTSNYIYGVGSRSGDIGTQSVALGVAEDAIVELDLRMDGCYTGKSTNFSLLGAANKKNTNWLDSTSQILTICATTSSTAGFWSSITVNGVDITAQANVSNGKANAESSGKGGLNRDTTGWLHLAAKLDFTNQQVDVTLTRISDDSEVYSGTLDFVNEDITSLEYIFMAAGKQYGGIFTDNIEIYKETVIQPDNNDNNQEETSAYVYTDNAVVSNKTYYYKVAAVVKPATGEERTSFCSRAISVKIPIALTTISSIVLEDIVEGTPLEEGKTVADLLPATVEGMDENGNQVQADITWDIGTLDISTVGSYTLIAHISGYATPVEVTQKVVANQIKGYAALDTVKVVQGMDAVLPEKIEVEYTNTTKEEIAVTWDTTGLDVNTVGEYILEGTLATELEGLSKKPTLTVKVVEDYIASVEKVYCEVALGRKNPAEDMPTTVTAVWAKGGTTEEKISWDVSKVDATAIGTYVATGTVSGYGETVTASVSVNYPVIYAFDFGIKASETSDGYIPVTLNTKGGTKTAAELDVAYSEEKKYGFLNEEAVIEGRSEEYTMEGVIPKNVYKDFVLPGGQTFAVDLPNGDYKVDVVGGSYYASTVKATVEGKSASISNAAGTYAIQTVDVTLTDGQLTVAFNSGIWRVDAVIIRSAKALEEAEEPGTSSSPEPAAPTSEPAVTPAPEPAVTPAPRPTATPEPVITPAPSETPAEEASEEEDTENETAGTDVDWTKVQETAQEHVKQLAGNTRTAGINMNVKCSGEVRIPANLLNVLKGNGVTLALQGGNGIAISISGRDLNRLNITNVGTLGFTMNTNAKGIPADVLATRATKFGRQFQISDTGSFTVPMNVHVSVGAENAGKVANLYRYNAQSNRLEYCSSFTVTENGQSMFALRRGGNYLVNVTNAKPIDTIRFTEGAYTVKSGDTLSQIAADNHMSLVELLRKNSQITAPSVIKIGEIVYLK